MKRKLTLLSVLCLGLLAGSALFPRAQSPENQGKTGQTAQEQEMERLFQASIQAYNKGDFPAAETALRAGLETAERLSDGRNMSRFLNSLGTIRFRQGEWEAARDLYSRALTLREKLGEERLIAMSLTNLGLVHENLEQFEKAMAFHTRALSLFEKGPSPRDIALSLNNVGNVHQKTGQYDRALDFYTRALAIKTPLGDDRETAMSLNNLGNVHESLGQFEKALDFYNRALALREKTGDPLEVAWMLNNLGVVYESLNQYDRALEFHDRALALRESANEAGEIAVSLNNMGGVYYHIGQWERAKEYHSRALQIFKKQGHSREISASLSSLGVIAYSQGRLREALELHQRVLALDKQRGVPQEIADSLDNLGLVYLRMGIWEKAQDFHTRALALREKASGPQEIAASYNNLGVLYENWGNLQQALRCYSRSIALKEPLGTPEDLALSLSNLGNVCMQLGQRERAEAAYKRAVLLFESVDEQIGDPAEMGAYQDAKQGAIYGRYAVLLARGKRKAEAIVMAERGRAQGLSRQMAQNRDDIASLFSEADAMQWKAANQDLTHTAALLSAARRREEEAIPTEKQAARKGLTAARKRFEDTERGLTVLRASLAKRYPEFRRLRGLEPPTYPRLKRLADSHADTLFLEWAVVDEKTTLCFALSKTEGLQSFTLPVGQATLSVLTQKWRGHLTASGDSRKDKAAAIRGEERIARTLYRHLLSPLEKAGLLGTGGARRLILVPDGPLLDIPFAALMDSGGRRLIDRYAVSTSVSLTALTWPANPRKPSASLLCFADPAGEGNEVLRSATRGKFGALPAARRETRSLIERYPRALGLFGQEAREKTFKKLAGSYALLHFATHGAYDGQDGKRSFLVLAEGEGEDGFLEAREILGMRLSARLATLSACDTAQGQKSGGEGLLGLAWAFRAAGCPSVIASQWKVDDAATGSLMTRFYEGLKQGKRKDEALRAAMQAVRKEPFHSPAYYWAAFQIIGDASPL